MERSARVAALCSHLLVAGCTIYQDPPAQYPQPQPGQQAQPQQPEPQPQPPAPSADPQYAPPPPEYAAPPPQYAPPPPQAAAPQQYTPPPPPPPSAFRGSPPPPPPSAAQSVMVPADRPEPVWTPPLVAGVVYTIEASGTYSVWGDEWEGVDAYYGYSPRHVGPQPQVWSQLLIDDRAMQELARANGDAIQFNPAHVYATSIQGTGRPLKLQILDARNGSWRDNHGALAVRLTPRGPAAPYAAAPTPPPVAATPPSAWRGAPPAPAPGAYVTGETVIVHSHRPEPVWTSAPLAPGAVYLIEASGVFSVWPDDREGVDALYEYNPRRVGPQPQLRPQLLVDDRPLADLARDSGAPLGFNPGHVYTATIRGTGQRVKLQILDARNGSWGDNHGALQVRITRR